MLRIKIFILFIACGVFSSCDQWAITTLSNNASQTFRLHLYYQGNQGNASIFGYPTSSGEVEYRWAQDSPAGELPYCNGPAVSLSLDSLSSRRDLYPVLNLGASERIKKAQACLDSLAGDQGFVLHWDLAPGEELFLGRVLGPSGSHYLDSLAMEDSGRKHWLKSRTSVSEAIEQRRRYQYLLRTTTIREVGEQEILK